MVMTQASTKRVQWCDKARGVGRVWGTGVSSTCGSRRGAAGVDGCHTECHADRVGKVMMVWFAAPAPFLVAFAFFSASVAPGSR